MTLPALAAERRRLRLQHGRRSDRSISLAYAKRSFYAAVNGLFRKLLNVASEEVFSELVRTKCIPILLYRLECFQLGKADRHFTVNRLCMKLFKTGSTHAVEDCQSYFAIGCRIVFLKEECLYWCVLCCYRFYR